MQQKNNNLEYFKQLATQCHNTARQLEHCVASDWPSRLQYKCMVHTTGAVLKMIKRLEKMSHKTHTR